MTFFDGHTETAHFPNAYRAREFVEWIMDGWDDVEIHVSLLMSRWLGESLADWRENRNLYN